MEQPQSPATTTRPSFLKQTLQEVSQPFIDLVHSSRAIWGINVSYLLEGLTYFGILGLLAIFFNQYIGLNDIHAGQMVGFLTAGITLGMLLLGATVDLIGVRKALIISLVLMMVGRSLLAASPDLGAAEGLWSSAHLIAMFGLLWIVAGYGIYQPACYAAVRKFSSEKTAAMGYAMLYALMNLGGFLPALISPPIRKGIGITGEFWVYVVLTLAGIAVVYWVLSPRTVHDAIAEASRERKEEPPKEERKPLKEQIAFYMKNFPLKDLRFLYFIFILIPVQTLFAHNWLTLPQYCNRAFTGVVSENFEFFVNFGPLLIFILTPAVTALTSHRNTYTMMIIGTAVMASPTFLLAIGPSIYTLMGYLIIMTLGEAMWSARFLQWIAEVAPPRMTGIYMGIGQFPWFLTKVITSLYSGWFLMKYCPEGVSPSETNTETMWLIYGFIAIITPIGLILARNWMAKGFKSRHGETVPDAGM
ncbi:MAG: major facilitator superfamily 1 [Bacteroidetes bacterium]|jgi:MFS family permease|nr:major facilitator superfamily 1 [Bacteroidota bacterium]